MDSFGLYGGLDAPDGAPSETLPIGRALLDAGAQPTHPTPMADRITGRPCFHLTPEPTSSLALWCLSTDPILLTNLTLRLSWLRARRARVRPVLSSLYGRPARGLARGDLGANATGHRTPTPRTTCGFCATADIGGRAHVTGPMRLARSGGGLGGPLGRYCPASTVTAFWRSTFSPKGRANTLLTLSGCGPLCADMRFGGALVPTGVPHALTGPRRAPQGLWGAPCPALRPGLTSSSSLIYSYSHQESFDPGAS